MEKNDIHFLNKLDSIFNFMYLKEVCKNCYRNCSFKMSCCFYYLQVISIIQELKSQIYRKNMSILTVFLFLNHSFLWSQVEEIGLVCTIMVLICVLIRILWYCIFDINILKSWPKIIPHFYVLCLLTMNNNCLLTLY